MTESVFRLCDPVHHIRRDEDGVYAFPHPEDPSISLVKFDGADAPERVSTADLRLVLRVPVEVW